MGRAPVPSNQTTQGSEGKPALVPESARVTFSGFSAAVASSERSLCAELGTGPDKVGWSG